MQTRAMVVALFGALVVANAHAADVSITKVALRQNSSHNGDNSVIRLQAFFVTMPPDDVFDPTNGVTIEVKDLGVSLGGAGTDVTVPWIATECRTVNGRTTCYANGKKSVRVLVKPFAGHPDAFSVEARIRNHNLTGPFEGPVEVTVTDNVSMVDRVGTITDCTLKLTGLTCRAF
jgi:hypothetical protein